MLAAPLLAARPISTKPPVVPRNSIARSTAADLLAESKAGRVKGVTYESAAEEKRVSRKALEELFFASERPIMAAEHHVVVFGLPS